ncbi:MAG: tetratricopeptide repeat protein, partial [Verrucomicrobiota bacterium]
MYYSLRRGASLRFNFTPDIVMDSETQSLIEKKFAEATQLHSSGKLEGAMLLYKEIHELDNHHADSIHLMGLAFHQLGESEQGAQLIRLAISIRPNEAPYYSNYGSVSKGLGDLEEALAAFKKAIEIDPVYLAPYFNMGEVLCLLGRLDEGEEAYRKAAELNAEVPDIWANLGVCLLSKEDLEGTEEALGKALQLQPSSPTALYTLGRLRSKQKRLDEAKTYLHQAMSAGFNEKECLDQLIAISEQFKDYEVTIDYVNRVVEMGLANADSYNSLSIAYQGIGDFEKAKDAVEVALQHDPKSVVALCTSAAFLNEMGEFEASIEQSQKTLLEDPNCVIAYHNLGASNRGLLKLEEAEEAFKKGLSIDPDYAEVHNNLALVMQHKGDTDAMIHHFERAEALKPDYASAFSNHGSAMIRCGMLTKAKELLEKAVEIDPGMVANWFNLGRLYHELGDAENSLASYNAGLRLEPGNERCLAARASTQIGRADVSDDEVFEMHVESGEALESGVEPMDIDLGDRLADVGRKRRLGFVSADFKTHSVAFFLLPLFRNLDRSQFEIYCYSSVESPDEVTAQFEELSDGWRSIVSVPDGKAVEQILADQIDILFDLSGATAGNRLRLFAFKPAPVQAAWLGYAHSTGLTRIDYRIVDADTDPEGMTRNTEELARLAGSFIVYAPREGTPEVAPTPMIEKGSVTFGSYNNLTKLNEASVALFSKVLSEVEGSRIVLKSHQVNDSETKQRIWSLFEAQGIAQDRVEMLPRFSDLNAHLESYG